MGARTNQLTWTLRMFYEGCVLYWFCPKWKRLLFKAMSGRNNDFDRSVEMGAQAVDLAIARRGPDHPDVAELLTLQAIYLRSQREDCAAAEPLFRRALEIHEKAFGPNHRRVWANLDPLADTLKKLGRHEEAESLYLRRLETAKHFLKPDPSAVASSLDDLAGFYREQGRHAEADRLYDEILEIQERNRDTQDADFRESVAFYFRSSRDHPDRAERLLKRLLALREQSLGPKHPGLAPVLEHLCDLCRDLQRYDEAEAHCTRALAILEKTCGPNHPDTADCLRHLVLVYQYQKQYDKAEPLLLRILEIRKSAMAADRDQRLPFLKRLTRRRQAEDYLADLHRRFRREDVHRALEHLANNHRMQKDYAGAGQYFRQALEIQEQESDDGLRRQLVSETLNELANLHIAQRQYAQADALLERVETGCRDDLDVFMAHYSRAHLYEEHGEFGRASEVYQNMLQTMEQGGMPQEMTATLLKDMARFYHVAGREGDAEACEQRAAALEPERC